MVFYSSFHKVKKLSLLNKVWMYPTAFVLKKVANGVVSLVDKFDERVTLSILINKEEK